MSMTPSERSMRSRLAAHALHARVVDEAKHTAPARDAFLARFEREVDPDGVLPVEERQRRAHHAMREHMLRLALSSSRSKRAARAREATREAAAKARKSRQVAEDKKLMRRAGVA